MSKVVGFVIGVALIVAGVATGNVGLIIQGGAMIVTQAIVDLTAPKVPARQASEMTIQLGETPRVAQFGETATAGSLVDGFNYGGKYGTDWECLVIRLADHKCEGLTGFYVNDEYNAYTGDGLVARYDDQLEIYFRSDTTNQALPSRVTDHGPGWTAADIGESGCDVVVCYKADKAKDKHPGWPGGRPRFLFVVKGKLCYDPRLDSTVTGGSGAHRWDDPATWEWSENPVICRYNWARGIYANDDTSDQAKLLVGRGLTAEEAPPENIIAAANLCEEVVAAVNPYEQHVTAFSLFCAFYSPDFSKLVITGADSFEVWNVATRSRIVPRTYVDCAIYGITVNADGSFYTTNSDGVVLVSEGGVTSVLSTDAAGGGVFVIGGLVCLTTNVTSTNAAYLSGDVTTYVPVGFNATYYFADVGGNAWAIGGVWSGLSYTTGIGFATMPVGTAHIVAVATKGVAFAVDNGAGKFFVWQENQIYLIDKTSFAVLAGPVSAPYSATGVAGESAPFRSVKPGATSIWIGFTQYSTQDLSVLRSETPSDWLSESINGALYDPINNAIWTRPTLGDHLTIRFLDRHGAYRIAGPVYSNQEFIDVEQMFAAATAGNVITHEGSVELEPGHAKSVVATITDDDLLTGAAVNWNNGVLSEANAEWVNSVVARYVEPDLQWQDHATPIARDTADIIADGRPREASITLRLVRHLQLAQRIAEINRRLGRLQGRAKVKLGPRFCWLENGDWISWQSDRYFAGATKTFRIDVDATDEKWQITLTLREIAASVYADDATLPTDNSQPTTTPPPTIIGTPDDAAWTLTATTLTSSGASVPALVVTGGATDDDSVEAIIVEYWKSDGIIDPIANPDDPPWTMAGRYAPTATRIEITGLAGGAVYYVAISYVVSGITGDRLVQGPVTIADLDVSGQASPKVLPIETVTGTSYSIVVADVNKHKRFTNAAAIAVTVPTNATQAYPIGGRTRLTAAGLGQVTLTPAGGVTLNSRDSALKSGGQMAVFEIEKVGTNEWDVLGDVTT